MNNLVSYIDFKKIDVRVGTIISAQINNKLDKPSIILKIDFGKEIGIKKSSAQLISNYNKEKLINKQIAAVLNFEPKQIGNLISEVLVLGFPDVNKEPILIIPDKKVSNGGKLY
jgi:tRNA-binding protein